MSEGIVQPSMMNPYVQAEAQLFKVWELSSAEATGVVREMETRALPAAVDHSAHARYVRHQGAYGCGLNAQAAVWDMLLSMYCPPNFHPNISVNRLLWAWRWPLTCQPEGQLPCAQRHPGTIPGHAGGPYATLDEYLLKEGCATEGSELTNSDAVQWPTQAGNDEAPNFRAVPEPGAKPGEIALAVPVTVDDLRHHLTGSPVRVGIWGNHFVALVGYDDARQRFKFVNSWGDQWGENGFGYVEYANLNKDIQSAQIYKFTPPKAMPCLRVKLSSSWRQDVSLWIGIDGTTLCKRIWPNGQLQDDSHNLWLTVTLPEGFAWPPTAANRIYCDVYDCGAHSSSGGAVEELIAGYNGSYVPSSALAGGAVPFNSRTMTRLTIP